MKIKSPRVVLPLRRSHAIAFGALTVGVGVGVVIGPMLKADASVTPIRAGQYCAPHGAVFRTSVLTLLCAEAVSSTRRVDTAWRWRDIGTGCPAGYVRQQLTVLLPRPGYLTGGGTTKILACAAVTPPAPTPTPTDSGTVTSSPTAPTPTTTQAPAPAHSGDVARADRDR